MDSSWPGHPAFMPRLFHGCMEGAHRGKGKMGTRDEKPEVKRRELSPRNEARAFLLMLSPLLAFLVRVIFPQACELLVSPDMARSLYLDAVALYLAISVVLLGGIDGFRLLLDDVALWIKAMALVFLLADAHLLLDSLVSLPMLR